MRFASSACVGTRTSSTFAPVGITKLKFAASGLANVIESKATSNAGFDWPTARTTTDNGNPVAASTERVIDSTNEPLVRGAIVSW